MSTQTFLIRMAPTMLRLSFTGTLLLLNPIAKANKLSQLHTFPRRWSARRRLVLDSTNRSCLPPFPPPHLVLHHSRSRDPHGNCRIRLPHPIQPTRSILGPVVRGAILLHRRCTSLLQRSHICNCERLDQYLRPQVFADTFEGRTWRLYHLRRGRDNNTDCWCGSSRSRILKSRESNHAEQHPSRRPRLSSVFFRRLSCHPLVDALESSTESSNRQSLLHCSFDCCNTRRLPQDMLQACGDC